MKPRTISRFPFQFVLSLLLAFARTETEEFPAENVKASPGDTITDVEIKTMLRDYIDTDKLGVGLAVGIMDEHGARVVCYGKMDNDTDRDVDGDSLFEIGSITKVFTALLLQDMVERGEMNLDDPVQRYLPDYVKMPTYQGKQITLLHLATHTSGLPGGPDNLSPRSWRDPDQADHTVEQLYSFLSRHKLPRAPGTREEYSNLGMELLGHVIALLIHLGPTLSISHETDELGNHLIASVRGVPGYDTAEFFPVSETSFNVNLITTTDDIRLAFVRNKKGKTTRVNVYWNGTKLRGARISSQPAK